MFFAEFNKNLTAKANDYDVANGAMGGSVRFSLFSICNYFSLQD